MATARRPTLNDPYETTETHLERLLGRALNSFDLPDTTVDRLGSALAHASSLHSSHHSARLDRATYRHAYLLADGSSVVLWELVHNSGPGGAEQHEVYADESEVRLAASRLPAGFPGFADTGPGAGSGPGSDDRRGGRSADDAPGIEGSRRSGGGPDGLLPDPSWDDEPGDGGARTRGARTEGGRTGGTGRDAEDTYEDSGVSEGSDPADRGALGPAGLGGSHGPQGSAGFGGPEGFGGSGGFGGLDGGRRSEGFDGYEGFQGFGAGSATDFGSDIDLLAGLLSAPPAPLPRMYVPDNSADHARRVLRRAENTDRPGPKTAELLRGAFAHHITQVFGRQCRVGARDAGFTLYEHAFLLLDGAEVSLWEVEHTATPDGRHMCEVYATESGAREAMESRGRGRSAPRAGL
ncbi:DUF6227 family protein [Streptomyces sp. NPDC006798]|uniref:DUF6227 family protein n=1 Tax=Streptomyces sp. NPDC006798 TaxID=3155462 RepID=UPI0033FBF0E5